MISTSNWKDLIADEVKHIADQEYQAKSWFGHSDKVSSPDEMFNRLFDDLHFEDFLGTPGNGLNAEQQFRGEALRDKMNAYAARTPPILDPAEVFNDPDWCEIRAIASDFYKSLLVDERGSGGACSR